MSVRLRGGGAGAARPGDDQNRDRTGGHELVSKLQLGYGYLENTRHPSSARLRVLQSSHELYVAHQSAQEVDLLLDGALLSQHRLEGDGGTG